MATLITHWMELKAPGDEWQPIETAPTNGEEVLTFNEENVLISASDAFGWFCCVDLMKLEPQPTHWTAMPQPPIHTSVGEEPSTLLSGSDTGDMT